MRLTIDQADLVRELQFLRGAVETATTIPILSHILAETGNDALTLTATNMDLAIRATCPARVQKTGTLALPAARFLDYIRLLGGDVELTQQENDWIGIACGRSRSRMAAMSRDQWPELPTMPADGVDLECETLAAMITRTHFAISTEESRFTLDGGLFHAADPASMVATDGHRLALSGSAEDRASRVLVPRKALAQVAKLAASQEGSVRFAHKGSHLFFDFGARLLISRELSGTFPDFRRVLPQRDGQTIKVDRLGLKATLERVGKFSDERSNAIQIQVRRDELVVSARVADVGESEESVPVSFDGPEVQIGFRAEYLLDFLRVVTCEKVRFLFTDGAHAGEFRPSEDDGYRYVVMPMRL